MTLLLYAHPFFSDCQNVVIALHENAAPPLLSADRVHEIDPRHARLTRYRAQLLVRRGRRSRLRSRRRRYRKFFPPGASDRD